MEWSVRDTARAASIKALAARAALARTPTDGNLWYDLGRRLMDAGQPDEAAKALRAAARHLPGDLRPHLNLAGALIRIDDYAGALAVARDALRLAPDDRAARTLEFGLLVRMGRIEEARAREDDIAEIDPANPLLLRLWRDTMHSPAEMLLLLRRCDAILADAPGNTAATHHKAMTLARLGRDDEARAAMDYEPLVSVIDGLMPEGHADIDAFCATLSSELQRNPTFVRDSSGRITENVFVSVNLEQPSDRAVPPLLRRLQGAVGEYSAKLLQTASRPSAARLASAQPKSAWLHAWGVIHRARGRIKTHFHDSAWLSGVFYVAAPRAGGNGAFGGPLRLGEVDERLAPRRAPPWPIIDVEPVPGRLVLFPAYLPHATAPAVGDGDRFCISFDVMPLPG
ncbi:MAG TPA: putative 2OG-Fe(II) oxygenase [Rhizomicrobium sp.]